MRAENASRRLASSLSSCSQRRGSAIMHAHQQRGGVGHGLAASVPTAAGRAGRLPIPNRGLGQGEVPGLAGGQPRSWSAPFWREPRSDLGGACLSVSHSRPRAPLVATRRGAQGRARERTRPLAHHSASSRSPKNRRAMQRFRQITAASRHSVVKYAVGNDMRSRHAHGILARGKLRPCEGHHDNDSLWHDGRIHRQDAALWCR